MAVIGHYDKAVQKEGMDLLCLIQSEDCFIRKCRIQKNLLSLGYVRCDKHHHLILRRMSLEGHEAILG